MELDYSTKLSTTITGNQNSVKIELKNYYCRDIVDWLIDKYPESMNVRDNVSRNPVS